MRPAQAKSYRTANTRIALLLRTDSHSGSAGQELAVSHLKLRTRAATKGLAVMPGTEGRLTTLEILIIFILTVFRFMGCTAANP
jgi:hypothetical protein